MKLTAEPQSPAIEWEKRPYQARLYDIEERDSTREPGATYALLVFEVIEDSDSKGLRLWKTSGWTLHPMGNLRAPAEALLNRKIKDGEDLDTDDLIGKECMVVVDPPEKEGDYAEITSYYPVQQPKGKTASKQQEPAEEEEDFSEIPF